MFKVTNTGKVFEDIDKWLAAVEAEVLKAAIALMWVSLRQAAKISPQYSGDFVANFRLSAGNPDTTFVEGVFPEKKFPTEEPLGKGDVGAIQYAMASNAGKLNGAKLGQTLWLANTSHHHDFYAWKIEGGMLKLRPVNYGGLGPLRQTKEYVKVHFSRIGKSHMEMMK